MRLRALFEDLDDQDTFEDCDYCEAAQLSPESAEYREDFHNAHTESHNLAFDADNAHRWMELYHAGMAKHGWKTDGFQWTKVR